MKIKGSECQSFHEPVIERESLALRMGKNTQRVRCVFQLSFCFRDFILYILNTSDSKIYCLVHLLCNKLLIHYIRCQRQAPHTGDYGLISASMIQWCLPKT